MNKSLSIAVGLLIMFGLTGCGGPSDNTVKNIAAHYRGAKPSDIKIVKSYEKDGKTIMILQINDMICEMPMLKIKDKWAALGLSCHN